MALLSYRALNPHHHGLLNIFYAPIPAILDAILLEAAMRHAARWAAGEPLQIVVNRLGGTPHRASKAHLLKPVANGEVTSEFEYRRDPINVQSTQPRRKRRSNGPRRCTEGNADAVRSSGRTRSGERRSHCHWKTWLGTGAAVTPPMLRPHGAALADLSQAWCVQAFSRAALNLGFFRSPAILRDFASDSSITAAEIARIAEIHSKTIGQPNRVTMRHQNVRSGERIPSASDRRVAK